MNHELIRITVPGTKTDYCGSLTYWCSCGISGNKSRVSLHIFAQRGQPALIPACTTARTTVGPKLDKQANLPVTTPDEES